MKQIEITPELDLNRMVEEIKTQDIVLTRQGHAVALLSDFDDDDLYWYEREKDPEFIASLKRGREQADQGQTVRLEDVKKELGID